MTTEPQTQPHKAPKAMGLTEVFGRAMHGSNWKPPRGLDLYRVREQLLVVILTTFAAAVVFTVTLGCYALFIFVMSLNA